MGSAESAAGARHQLARIEPIRARRSRRARPCNRDRSRARNHDKRTQGPDQGLVQTTERDGMRLARPDQTKATNFPVKKALCSAKFSPMAWPCGGPRIGSKYAVESKFSR